MVDYKIISDFMDDYLIAKEIEEGCAPSTIKAYRYDLQKFINIVGDLEVNSLFLRQNQHLLFLYYITHLLLPWLSKTT
ncbi:hypothetical protein ES703_53067 [subsurface metagenome]